MAPKLPGPSATGADVRVEKRSGQEACHYALLRYRTQNIGDEIQSLAAAQYLPRIDLLLDRDRPRSWHTTQATKLVLNGWFKLRPEEWPIKDSHVSVLPISMHLSDVKGSSLEMLFTRQGLRWFKENEPIGCRDLASLDLLRKRGVQAYFSGCLTLTLRRPAAFRTGEVLLVDLPAATIASLPASLRASAGRITHITLTRQRFLHAYKLLERYSAAKFVITSRLHCALPCLAFDTPVLLVKDDFDDPRLAGLADLIPCASTAEVGKMAVRDLLAIAAKDRSALAPIQRRLRQACNRFVVTPALVAPGAA